jgi:hypothetical protein
LKSAHEALGIAFDATQEATKEAFRALDDELQDVHIDLLAEVALLQARMDGTLNRSEKRVWQ